jgi:hypothetical protein
MEDKLADEQRSMDALMRIEAGHQDALENSLDGPRSKLKNVYGKVMDPTRLGRRWWRRTDLTPSHPLLPLGKQKRMAEQAEAAKEELVRKKEEEEQKRREEKRR